MLHLRSEGTRVDGKLEGLCKAVFKDGNIYEVHVHVCRLEPLSLFKLYSVCVCLQPEVDYLHSTCTCLYDLNMCTYMYMYM